MQEMAKKRQDGYFQKVFTFKGKRYSVYAKSQKELFEKERAKREELEAGFIQRENPTVNEYYSRWTEARRGTIKEHTLRGQQIQYKMVSEVVIPNAKRAFGELKIRDVTIDDLRIVQAALLETRKTQTTNDYMAHVNHCFSDAMKERVIDYNPFVLLHNLKRTEEKARDTTHRALSIEEQKRFFECERCKSSFYYNIFRIAILTGMRAGEIGALKTTDIRGGVIRIERTITRTEAGNYVVGEDAKTEAGRRTIPMNEKIKEVIASQKELNTILDGNVVTQIDGDLLFKAPERGLLMSTPTDREIKRICKACGVEPFTMHCFRHTFATRCIEGGMSIKTLQELLGHKSFNITMSLYGHVTQETKQEEMNNIHIAI